MTEKFYTQYNFGIVADATKIRLNRGDYKILPNNKLRSWEGNYSASASRSDRNKGLYRPKVLINQTSGRLTIEFSPAKLKYGNNIQVVSAEEFPQILHLLKLHLADFGIQTTEQKLEQGRITKIEFGWNFYLPKEMTVSSVLHTLNSCLTSGHKRQYRIQYENGGRSFRVGNASSDFLIYDKLYAPEQCGGEEYYNLKPLKEILQDPDYNILRIEYRATNRASVRKLFKQYGINTPMLKHICYFAIGRDVITEKWEQLIESCVFPNISQKPDLWEEIKACLEANKHMGIKPRMAFAYASMLNVLKKHSVWEIKNLLLKLFSTQTVDNFLKEIRKLSRGRIIDPSSSLDYISTQIECWEQVEPRIEEEDFSLPLEEKKGEEDQQEDSEWDYPIESNIEGASY